MFGMESYEATTATITIATGALLITDTLTTVAAESASADTLDTITNTNAVSRDIVHLFADTGDTITVTHDFGGVGSIHLLSGQDQILSELHKLHIQLIGTEWYELAGINQIQVTVGGTNTTLQVKPF